MTGSPGSPMTGPLRLAGVIVVEGALVAGLHELGRVAGFAVDWSDPFEWIEAAPLDDVVGAIVLLIALALSYWLLASTIVFLVVSFSGRSQLVRAVGWATWPPIRRLAGRALGITIAASAVTGSVVPAITCSPGGEHVIVEMRTEGQLVPPGQTPPVPVDDPSDIVFPPHLGPASPQPPVVESGDDWLDGSVVHRVEVRHGDHMWSMSEDHLRRVTGRTSFDDHEIARYWVRVIDENRTSIRSGDPDLIYPGEVLVLPPVERAR